MKTDHIYFGAAYYDEYMPYDRIEIDMEMMKKANMNVIRIGESTWSTMEPEEGIFDFTHLDRMLEASEKYAMQVIIGTPTYAIPSWLCRKYPDILAITHQGPGIYGHRQNMDITHKGYLHHCEIIIRKMLSHIQHRKTIIGYQLDNETKSYDTCGVTAQKMFVEYLKSSFPDINEFNQVFGLNYWSNRIQNWNDFPDVRGTINGSLAGEYKKFQRKLVTDFLSWQAAIVREYSSEQQFITQNFDYGWTDHSFGMQPEVNQFDAGKCLTVAGFDIYHPSQENLTGIEISFGGGIARSIKRDNYLILETQAQGNISWLPFDGQLKLQAFSHFANGSNSVLYWNWHSIHNAIESYWKGVLGHDLAENRTYLEAVEIGIQIQQYGNRIKNLKKKNSLAFLLDNHSLTGLQEFPISKELSYNHIFRWLYDSFYRLNVESDIIQIGDWEALRNLNQYKFLVVPALYSASNEVIQLLNAYVKQGGHLITTFKTAYSNEYLKIYHDTQPHGLTDCLGIQYNQYTIPQNVTLEFEKPYKTSSGSAISYWMELIQVTSAKIIAQANHKSWGFIPTITQNEFGLGSATYLASYFEPEILQDYLREFLQEKNELKLIPEFPLIHKSGVNDYDNTIHYFFNYSQDTHSLTYLYGSGKKLVSNEVIQTMDTIILKPWDYCIIEEM